MLTLNSILNSDRKGLGWTDANTSDAINAGVNFFSNLFNKGNNNGGGNSNSNSNNNSGQPQIIYLQQPQQDNTMMYVCLGAVALIGMFAFMSK